MMGVFRLSRVLVWLGVGWLTAAVGWLVFGSGDSTADRVSLLNVSFDPTRELWRDLNRAFAEVYEAKTGTSVVIRQSHGGSATQARAVIDGLEADVVTLALRPDIDAISRVGLIQSGWIDRLPRRSLPYYSTIVFVVRSGNPKGIRDWPDLVQPGLRVIAPNPKTSGNGKLAFLAAWGSVRSTGGDDGAAERFVTELYRRVPVLDSGARASATTFAQRGIGDVHLAWESEAYLEVRESGGRLEIVYPKRSIRAEPHVALVTANARRHGTETVAQAYLQFLYTPKAQRIMAMHRFRPIDEGILAEFRHLFPEVELFDIGVIARNWEEAHRRFFADGAMFDQILDSLK